MGAPAITAETQINWEQYEIEMMDTVLPEVLVVPDMLADQETRARAARFIGAVVVGSDESVEVAAIQKPIESLYEAIHRAKAGDKVADALVETNIATDVIERTIKTGHVMKPVPLLVSGEGKIFQHGQYMDSVQANSLRYAADHPIMRARTEAETRNAFRIEELNQSGFFEDYSFVVISRAEKLPEAGFFTDTMSCSIQVTSKRGEGLATESAFVAGIAVSGAEQHDEKTVIKLGRRLEVDFSVKSPAEIIDTPILVRNDLIPNGAIDVVRIFDECSGTFFGEDKPKQDYLAYLAQCRKREQTFVPKIQQIKTELLADAENIHKPIHAVRRLHELSEKHMVEHAVQDETINPDVFGPVAAGHIEIARWHIAMGNHHDAQIATSEAQETAQSSSCPTALKGLSDDPSDRGESPDSTNDNSDCEFVSKKCPECGAKDVKTVVKKRNNKKVISGDCGCSVTV